MITVDHYNRYLGSTCTNIYDGSLMQLENDFEASHLLYYHRVPVCIRYYYLWVLNHFVLTYVYLIA